MSASTAVVSRECAWVDPEDAFVALHGSAEEAVWLDSGPDASAGVSVMGVLTDVRVERDPVRALPALRAAVAGTPRVESGPLGWVGWVGYEAGAAAMGAPFHAPPVPALVLGRLERALVFDHAARVVRLVALGPDAAGWVDAAAARVDAVLPAPAPASVHPGPVRWRHDRERYLGMIAEVQELIRDGGAYQVCLCNEAVVPGRFDPLAVYRRLRRSSPTHHGAYVRAGGVALACGSPEQFLAQAANGSVTTRPMKGTRPRGVDRAEDDALAAELRSSEKETAENLMIVDLMRNDLSRVAVPGTVRVDGLFDVERYATVHQLVSTVGARLAEGRTTADVLEAALPPGSMTGAPKHSAVTTIARLENGPRGVFAGVVGRISDDGSADLAVVIRSVVVEPVRATIGVGGGITALSDPAAEHEETLLKARTMLSALGVAAASG